MNNLTLSEFEKLHSDKMIIITEVNSKKLCNEEDYEYDVYYIKIETDKYPEVDWGNECCFSICKYNLDDAKVVNTHYSVDFDLFG